MDIVERASGLSDKSTNKEILDLTKDAMDLATDEIKRLRARVKLLEKTLIKAAIALEDQGLYQAPLMCRKIVEGGEK